MAKSTDAAKGAAHIDVSDAGGKQTLPENVDELELDLGEDVDAVEEEDKDKADDKKPSKKEAPKKDESKKDDAEEDDAEEEDDEEEEEEEDDAKKGAREGKHQVKMVPQARMMRIKAQRDALQQQLAEAQRRMDEIAKSSTKADQIAKFEQQVADMYEKLENERAAGNVKEAARLARELDKLKDESNIQRQKVIAEAQTKQQLEMALYNNVLSQLEAQYPELNPDAAEYDEDMVADIDAITRGYEMQGRSASEALKAAARRVLGKDALTDRTIRRDESKVVEPRKVDRAKNAAAAKKQPPAATGEDRAERSQELKVSNMTREEFNKLPEAVQNRLLGNEL